MKSAVLQTIVLGTSVAFAGCGFDAELFGPVPIPPSVDASADASDSASLPDAPVGTAFAAAAGQTFTCALNRGRASCWGSNVAGALGSGDYVGHASPNPVVGGRIFDAITAGENHACAIETGTSLPFCWGANARGQLGTGDAEVRLAPTAVVDIGPVKQIAAGYDFTCAITRDDALYCWGEDYEGELAIPDMAVDKSVRPVRVDAGATFRAVSGGQGHACAIRSTGTIACWGRNNVGQLGTGDGAPIQLRAPTDIVSSRTWSALDLGQDSACAIDTNGALFCWGQNSSGQLGIAGTQASSSTPIAVGAQFTSVDVSVDAFGACARDPSGTLWCWGRNTEGQLGLGDTAPSVTPSQVSGPPWTSVSVGRFHTCATAVPHLLACTGDNSVGQLGVGDNNRRQTFTEVAIP